MDNSRFMPAQRGKFDDVIAWLKRFENVITVWSDQRKGRGIFAHLAEYPQHAQFVESFANALNWEKAAVHDKTRTMHWIHVGEAWHAITHEMEGWYRCPPDDWREHVRLVHEARVWFEQNNEPEDSMVKY